jgi:hypothetical protein
MHYPLKNIFEKKSHVLKKISRWHIKHCQPFFFEVLARIYFGVTGKVGGNLKRHLLLEVQDF